MKLKHVEGLDSVKIHRGEDSRWYGIVTFHSRCVRAYPDEWEAPIEPGQRTYFEWVSPNGRVWMSDTEAHHHVCAQVAAFLLGCHALDQQEALTRKLMKRRQS